MAMFSLISWMTRPDLGATVLMDWLAGVHPAWAALFFVSLIPIAVCIAALTAIAVFYRV
jgi:hypothetical protein